MKIPHPSDTAFAQLPIGSTTTGLACNRSPVPFNGNSRLSYRAGKLCKNPILIFSFRHKIDISYNAASTKWAAGAELISATENPGKDMDVTMAVSLPRIITFYLPQYHSIPENDTWWGSGFTDWDNVRSAKPLFAGHRQPRVPLTDNYYDLLDPNVRAWQASLAKDHGIHGFCYYHYWFNGHRLLERPIVEVLRSGEPDLPFCFAWANEPWTRSWDGLDKDILMPQNYGNESDWESHFQALLPAFRDARYICLEGKPVFVIYRSRSIPLCEEMLSYWRVRAHDEGLPGLHLVSMLTSFERDERPLNFDAFIEFEPMHTVYRNLPFVRRFCATARLRLAKILNRLGSTITVEHRMDYRIVWRIIANRQLTHNTYPGAFIDWDNSPRRGTSALVMTHVSVVAFRKYFSLQFSKAFAYQVPFLFVNAWNEWAEAAYLEPDTDNNYAYLETIKDIVGAKYQP
jgi:hypothetical protein